MFVLGLEFLYQSLSFCHIHTHRHIKSISVALLSVQQWKYTTCRCSTSVPMGSTASTMMSAILNPLHQHALNSGSTLITVVTQNCCYVCGCKLQVLLLWFRSLLVLLPLCASFLPGITGIVAVD